MASNNQGQPGAMGNEGNPMPTNQPANKGAKMGGKSERGFASMDPERQRAIASEGGKAAHLSGNAHEFTSEEARAAGRKGGQASGGHRGSGNRANPGGSQEGQR